MIKKKKYSDTDVIGVVSFHKSTESNNTIQVRLNKELSKYFNTGYIVFNPVKMTIREGTIADNNPRKLTSLIGSGCSFSYTCSNRDELIGDYEVEESTDEKQLYLLYKI